MTNDLAFLAGGGAVGDLMRTRDWSTSPLGAPENWPQSLRSVVGLMLTSRFPMFVAWGPDLGFLYNDAYAPILGAKHPNALGRRFHDIWAEIWPDISPLIDAALAGEASFHENLPLVMHRKGFDEQTWFTFSYSPVRDETGAVAGMFCAAIETTDQVQAEARRAAETERQRRMFEQAPGFICTLSGPEHVFDFANAAYRRVFGDRDYIGRSVVEVFPEIADQSFSALLDRVYATGERFVATAQPIRFLESPGGPEIERYLDFIYAPIQDDAGAVTGIFCEGYDVTERILADNALRETAARESFLVALADTLRPMTDPADIVAATTRALGEQLDAHRVAYAEVDEALGVAQAAGDWTDGVSQPLPPRMTLAEFGQPLIAALRTGATLTIDDVRLHPATQDSLAALGSIGVAALISVPLVKDGQFVANLNIHCRQPRAWTAADVELAEAVAARTWDVLARAHAVQALADRELELETLTDNLPVLISYVDRDLRYRFMNRLYETWFPHRREELVGQRVIDVIGPDAFAGVQHHMARALGGETVSFEQYMPYKEGGHRHVVVDYVPRFDAGGEVVGFYALVQDVTARKTAEAAARESDARFQLMADHAPVMMWVTNPAGHCTYLNARWYEYTGQAPGSGEGLGWLDAVHPDDRAVAEAAFLEANADERNYHVDFRLRRADGLYRWHLDTAAARFTDTGEYLGYIGSVIDIEERKGAEEFLERRVAEQTAERNRVWEMSRDLFAIMGFDGRLKAINPAWETTLGRHTDALLADDFTQQVHPDDHPAVEAMMQQLLRGETVSRFEDRLRHADGSWRWISWTLVPEGEVFYAVGRDVTAEREAAHELEQAQEALRQSQKMEAMGQLTGGVAHDFNNLLTPIVGSLDMLQRQGLGGQREQRLIAGALQSADRARTLVQRLLAFARRQPLQAMAVDVSRLVTGMAELVASTTGPQIRLQVDAPEGLPAALADPNQLEMALLNLGVNARDAMPAGGILTMAVSLETAHLGHPTGLPPGDYIRLCVADTGVGMDEATRRRAIEPFFSTKGIGKGTGLGLSMVHGLALQLGGALTLDSTPGQGTAVALWLPLSQAPAQDAGLGGPVRMPAPSSRGVALLVDDEELVRASTADMLTEFGYRVVEAPSAEDALALVEGGLAPDLLVTDHLMPGLTGAELARALQAKRPALPVLIVSGYAEAEGLPLDLPRLTKPFRSAELAASLAALAPADHN